MAGEKKGEGNKGKRSTKRESSFEEGETLQVAIEKKRERENERGTL